MLAPAIDTTFSEVLKLPEQSGRALASSAQVKILTVFVTETIKTWRSLGEANHIIAAFWMDEQSMKHGKH